MLHGTYHILMHNHLRFYWSLCFLHSQIMIPMVSRGHWTLYDVNTVKRCIHILDSNPYEPKLGGTTWRDYHFAQMDLGGKKIPWAKVIMSRLNKALQHVRPRSCFPKFGNFAIDLSPNCPTMEAGSNDCGFYVMGVHSILWLGRRISPVRHRSGTYKFISSFYSWPKETYGTHVYLTQFYWLAGQH
jgi:hypothetical protein